LSRLEQGTHNPWVAGSSPARPTGRLCRSRHMLRVHVQQNRVHILLGPAGHLTVQFDRRMHDLDHPDEELVAGTGLGELFDLRVRQEHWITLCYTVPAPPHTNSRPG